MMKTIDFLAEIIRRHDLKDRHGNTGTQYSLWKYMNEKYSWSHAAVSNYFNSKGFPDKEQCMHIASELELDAAYVLVCIEADRTKDAEIKAVLENAAERLKGPAKKAATRRSSSSKTSKVASVILSLGAAIALTQGAMKSPQLTEAAGNFQQMEFVQERAGSEQCVLCQIVDSLLRAPLLPLASFLLLLSVITYRLAHDRGLLRSNNNKNNNKKNASGGLSHDGRDAQLLPASSRLVTTAGSQIVRLFPANLPARRGSGNPTGRRARVIEIRRRAHPRMAGLSDQRRLPDPAGRHTIAPQHLGGLELCAATAGGTDRDTSSENRGTRSAHPHEPAPTLPVSTAHDAAGTESAYFPSSRSCSARTTNTAPNQRPAARRAFVRAAALALLGFAGNAAAAPAITLGLISEHHTTTTAYDETNPGLCLESGFTWYVTGCLYEDSQSQPAGVLAAGGRISISDWFHIGAGFGLQFHQALNKAGEETIDPDPVIAGTLTLGPERLALQIIRTPEHDTKHATIPATDWLQLRVGF